MGWHEGSFRIFGFEPQVTPAPAFFTGNDVLLVIFSKSSLKIRKILSLEL